MPPPSRERKRAEAEQRECALKALRHLHNYCLMQMQKKRASAEVRALFLKVRLILSTIVEIDVVIAIPVQNNANITINLDPSKILEKFNVLCLIL